MTRRLIDCVRHTDLDLAHHRAFWEATEAKLPPGSLENDGELGSIWTAAVPLKPAQTAPTPRTEWVTTVKVLSLSQPDSVTCQAACIAMAVGDRNIYGIRRKLQARASSARSSAGDPVIMGHIIRDYGRPYTYDGNATLAKVYEWLKDGEFLITHGYFTPSGHVICLDGLKRTSRGYQLNVKDPWSQFDEVAWAYNRNSRFFDGFYSDLCIYAACVASASAGSARQAYRLGKIDLSRGRMWVHRFHPE